MKNNKMIVLSSLIILISSQQMFSNQKVDLTDLSESVPALTCSKAESYPAGQAEIKSIKSIYMAGKDA